MNRYGFSTRRKLNPRGSRHTSTQGVLRIVGPALLGTGVVFTAVGFVSFFRSFGSWEAPSYFWCAFVGLPLTGVGLAITKFAYLGAISRYIANEVAPVGTDAFNYVAEETRDSVRDLATAVGAGSRDGFRDHDISCRACGQENDTDAKFCDSCGKPLTRS